MFNILKKFRVYFYNIYFILKIDVEILIAQFNKLKTNFSKTLFI